MTTLSVEEPPTPSVPTVQRPVPELKLPWFALEEKNVYPDGRVSVTRTFVVGAGPAFVTVIEKVTSEPTSGAGFETDFASEISACACAVRVSVAGRRLAPAFDDVRTVEVLL
jgi:hypothetical protein